MKNSLRGVFLFLTALIVSIRMNAQDNILKILRPDGQQVSIKLDDKPSAKFVGDTLVITTQSQELTFNLDDGSIVQATFINGAETAVEKNDSALPVLNISSYGIEGSGWKARSIFYLYNLSGELLSTSMVNDDGTIKMPISNKGIYLIKTSFSTFKIKKL